MSRHAAPDPGWSESTEGDLDRDLTDEAGSSLDDWTAPAGAGRSTAAMRIIAIVVLVAILGLAIAGTLIGRAG